jgi:hypothetical protein
MWYRILQVQEFIKLKIARNYRYARNFAFALPAIALLPGFDKSIAAHRAVEEGTRTIAQAVVHPVLESEGEILEGAGGPEGGPHGGGGRRHDAALQSRQE